MNPARKAVVPGFRKASRVCGGLTLLVGLLVSAPSAEAWDGTGGVLWVCPWDGPDARLLEPHRGASWLLAHTQDLALLLFPEDPSLDPAERGRWSRLGDLDPSGSYYIYSLADAGADARFEPPARVLFRRRHTAVLWTPGALPELTSESREAHRGLNQPLFVTVSPKAWPMTASALEKEQPPPFDILVDGIVDDVLEESYVAFWQALDDYETRYTFTEQNEAVVQWMADVFASYGLDVELHEYEQEGLKNNVVATLPGTEDPSKIVYISAHFDSKSEDPVHHAPGADDNASGTAAVLEAARVLSQYAFRYTIKFAGFNGEEQGIRGSLAYVQDILAQGEDVLGCFNLDMIAYRGTDADPPDVVIYTNEESVHLAETVRDNCLRYFPEDLEPRVIVWALGVSDHKRFWNHGYDAVFIVEDDVILNDVFPGPDFCPWYHSSEDRIEKYPRDYPARVAAAVVAAVAQTARPRTATTVTGTGAAASLRLMPVSPNPSRGSFTMRLHLPKRQRVSLAIYDVRGKRIRSLASESLGPGLREFQWNGLDDHGRSVGPGVFFSTLDHGGATFTVRLVLLD